jgi:hypothetical protein
MLLAMQGHVYGIAMGKGAGWEVHSHEIGTEKYV